MHEVEIEKHFGDDVDESEEEIEKRGEIINILTNHNNNSLILSGLDTIFFLYPISTRVLFMVLLYGREKKKYKR